MFNIKHKKSAEQHSFLITAKTPNKNSALTALFFLLSK